jgi:hypothetical protein
MRAAAGLKALFIISQLFFITHHDPHRSYQVPSILFLSMLGLGRRSKAKKDVAVAPEHAWPITSTSSERIARLITTARSKLEPMASADHFDTAKANKAHVELGDIDGVGLLLKIASFPLKADGTVGEEELRHFERESTLLIDTLCSSMLNYSVLLSLLLTIFVSLQVAHVGSEPYEQAPLSHKLGTTRNTAAAGDAAAFLCPQDPESFRWVFYVLECIFLSAGTLVCVLGLGACLGSIIMLSNLPSAASKLEFLMGRLKRLAAASGLLSLSIMLLIVVVLPAVLARASAVAFLCACGSGLVFLILVGRHMRASDEVKVQITEARIVLAEVASRRAEQDDRQ